MSRRVLVAFTSLALFLAGCGGGSTTAGGAASSVASAAGSAASAAGSAVSSAAAGATGGGTASATSAPTSTATGAAAACPTENTRNFAKTRFVADVGGSLFLFNRYIYQPYKRGSFQQGAQGRRTALIKGGAAAAGIAKLLKNASENAKANPTLCRTVAEPLSQATTQIGGLATGLATGSFNPATLDGLSSLFGRVTGQAKQSGFDISEVNPNLPGLR